MRERTIESRLRRAFLRRGGYCFKWTSPGTRGVPDRIGFLPWKRIWFIETKAPGGDPSPIQRVVHKMLAKIGFPVWVIDSDESLDNFINSELDAKKK